MINKNLFLETLHEVAEIAATSGEKIKPEEVHKYFEGMELSPEQEKMVYEYLNLPPEAKQAPVAEEEEVTEDAEEIETVEVYSTTDSSKDIQIGTDRVAEDEEEDVPQAKDVEKLSDSVYYRMYLDEVRGRGETDEAKMRELYQQTRTEGFGPEVRRRILLGTFVLSSGYYDAYYLKALRAKGMIKRAFDEAFCQCDVMLTPTAPAAAPRLGESLSDPLRMYLSDIDTVPVNLAGLPGLSMPCGFDETGLPVGAQLIGPPLGEKNVLNAAHAFQLETDWHTRAPAEKEVG